MKAQVQLKSKRGQNTAEYLIMLTLVAIGSIGLMTAFGKTIQSKIAYVSSAIAGNETEYETSKKETEAKAKKANEKAKKVGDIKMEGVDKENLKSE